MKISLVYKDKVIENSYKRNNKVVVTEYNFTREKDDYSPLTATIVAIESPALYSMEIKPNAEVVENRVERVNRG